MGEQNTWRPLRGDRARAGAGVRGLRAGISDEARRAPSRLRYKIWAAEKKPGPARVSARQEIFCTPEDLKFRRFLRKGERLCVFNGGNFSRKS